MQPEAFFALDTGRFGQTGHVYYFAPDTLEWESTELAYSGFLTGWPKAIWGCSIRRSAGKAGKKK